MTLLVEYDAGKFWRQGISLAALYSQVAPSSWFRGCGKERARVVWRAPPQARGPQHSPGTLSKSPAQPLAYGWVAVTGVPAPQPKPTQRLVQTLSFCRPTGISVLGLLEQLLTHLHSSHTSAHGHICTHLYTPHSVLLMYMSYTCSHMSCTCSSAHINICTAHVCSHVHLGRGVG